MCSLSFRDADHWQDKPDDAIYNQRKAHSKRQRVVGFSHLPFLLQELNKIIYFYTHAFSRTKHNHTQKVTETSVSMI